MAYTVQQVVSAVQRRLPDMQTTILVQLVNEIHRQILSEIPELRRDVISVNLTAGTREYAIAEPVYQVEEAVFVTALNTTSALMPTTTETLDQVAPTWREDPNGQPTEYYLSSNQVSGNSEVIGLWPTPNLTTSGGYPILQLFVSELQGSDLGLSDSCLTTLFSSQIYVEGVSFLAANEVAEDLGGVWFSNFEREMDKAKIYTRTRLGELKSAPNKNARGGGNR